MWKVATLFLIYSWQASANVSPGDIQYFLWNPQTSREEVWTNHYGNNVDPGARVKIFVHGWMDNIDSFWYEVATAAYVAAEGANVIVIDWSQFSRLLYSTSVGLLPDIGSVIAQFIIGLANSQGIPLDRFHLVGHSLGGQLVGFIGKAVQRDTGERVGRITGMDPAGPSFTLASSANRLHTSDANRVDTILTDTGLTGLGINRSLGHVNFWANGGTATQPGCSELLCSHYRSAWYFVEGITSVKFVSTRCSNYASYTLQLCRNNPKNLLGEFTDHSVTGDFFLTTNGRAPFARG